jgi:3-keto-disaccharide hydrolase
VRLLLAAVLLLSACSAPSLRWRPLFDGEDLAGWEQVNCAPDTFTVKDGLIHCSGKPTGVLRTARPYTNFVLELEWRHLSAGGNSGLFVWSDPLPALGVPFTRSFEVQIMDGTRTEDYTSDGDVFSIWGAHFSPDRPHPKGWERCLPSENRVRPSPEWNQYSVTCSGGTLKLAVNGAEVSGGTEATPRSGYICLESEGSEVEFRNLRILELPGPQPPPDQVAEAADSSRTLFDGLTLAGWHVAGGGAPDPVHWQVRDGTIWTDGKGGDLAPDLVPRNFELRLDWKREGTPSGRLPLVLWGWQSTSDAALPGGWHRARASQRGQRSGVDVEGEPRSSLGNTSPHGTEPLLLRADGQPTVFTNLFVRDLDS